ncbi:MAG: Rieske 2Fe-2S domain-containing protein [Proteobacteria bacterium]|nr:Rieske 2Fe-2S domain-containing protein [Pseudomonadota bacterium]MBI3496451.1 Rieske 2Fe-2S domain-containing protein [Pseudomonadota bacterium]
MGRTEIEAGRASGETLGGTWRKAIEAAKLGGAGKAVAKVEGKQIALFQTADGVFACNNRCPHEGYPLREGTLDGACVLTCNWHNWKFDLKTGANLYGGDRLRTYPTRTVDGAVWVDIADPPKAELRERALANLKSAFEDEEYDRIAREIARLAKAEADPVTAVAAAIGWSHDRLQYGTTHAFAAAEAWLRLHDGSNDAETRLVAILEAIGYMAFEVAGEEHFPYAEAETPWDEAEFLAAFEAEDETRAIATLRGALSQGLHFADIEGALTRAALAHYAGFGHSLIYLRHSGRLIQRLGRSVEAPLLLALVRAFVYAPREDRIPEFRAYGEAFRSWPRPANGSGDAAAMPPNIRGRSVEEALKALVDSAETVAPARLYDGLLAAAAANLLEFDTGWDAKTDSTVAQNVNWLDFTHGITFANAARAQCSRFPELWPAALLQMACFVARNTGFTQEGDHLARWRVGDRQAFHADSIRRITDHGEDRYILSAHLLKTFLAASEEVERGLAPEIEGVVLAALNRFLNASLKRKHVRRTAHQALSFVQLED